MRDLGRVGWIRSVGFAGLALLASSAGLAAGSPGVVGGSVAACGISQVSDGSFASRSRVVRFPDGRILTVIGLNHGNRDLKGGTADTLSRARSAADVGRLLAAQPAAAVADAREAVRFLRENRFSFIAAEASSGTVANNLKSYAQVRSRIRRFAGADDAMRLAFGADFYVRLTDAGAPPLIGVEDEALGEAYLRALPVLNAATAKLAWAKFDADVAAKMNEFVNSLAVRYVSFRPESDDLLKEAHAKFDHAQDFAKIEPFLKARIDVMTAMKLRDRHDAGVLVARRASGVLLIGSTHLDSIAALLHDACAGSTPATGAVSGAK